jgi:hypothetical protein
MEHKGQRVWLSDVSGLGVDIQAFDAEIEVINQNIQQEPENSVRVLIDIRGTVGSGAVLRSAKQSTDANRPFIKRTAVVGIEGEIRMVLLDAVARFSHRAIKQFNADEMDKALDWLVQE